MKPLDFTRAAGLAVAIMIINVLLSVVVIAVYSYAIAPGHDAAFYEAAAPRIAPWSSVTLGAPLFFGAAYWSARRRPDRNALAFAGAIFLVYAAIDVTVVLAAGGPEGQIGVVLLSLGTKLAAALGGASIGTRRVVHSAASEPHA